MRNQLIAILRRIVEFCAKEKGSRICKFYIFIIVFVDQSALSHSF